MAKQKSKAEETWNTVESINRHLEGKFFTVGASEVVLVGSGKKILQLSFIDRGQTMGHFVLSITSDQVGADDGGYTVACAKIDDKTVWSEYIPKPQLKSQAVKKLLATPTKGQDLTKSLFPLNKK